MRSLARPIGDPAAEVREGPNVLHAPYFARGLVAQKGARNEMVCLVYD